MLDTFEILTTSGVVIWSKSYAPINPSVINSLISDVFIEERTLPGAGIGEDISAANNPPYKHDQHTLKWTTVKELGLIFVVSVLGYNSCTISGSTRALLIARIYRLSIDHSCISPGLTNWLIMLGLFSLIFMEIS
jgi:hypothetical protein